MASTLLLFVVDPEGKRGVEMSLKIVVDWDLCESNFECNDACPDLFKVDDAKDELVVFEGVLSEALIAEVESAAARCPKGAITLVDA